MIDNFSYELIDNPARELWQVVDEGLDQFNIANFAVKETKPFGCYVRDGQGEIVAGALARTNHEVSELQQIWVKDELRGRGLGEKVLAAVEEHARARGCRSMFLETFSFQAPEFYKKYGYRVCCELGGFIGGVSKFVMEKPLV